MDEDRARQRSGVSVASSSRFMAPFDQPMTFAFSIFRCFWSARKSSRTAAIPRSASVAAGPDVPMPRGSK